MFLYFPSKIIPLLLQITKIQTRSPTQSILPTLLLAQHKILRNYTTMIQFNLLKLNQYFQNPDHKMQQLFILILHLSLPSTPNHTLQTTYIMFLIKPSIEPIIHLRKLINILSIHPRKHHLTYLILQHSYSIIFLLNFRHNIHMHPKLLLNLPKTHKLITILLNRNLLKIFLLQLLFTHQILSLFPLLLSLPSPLLNFHIFHTPSLIKPKQPFLLILLSLRHLM